MSVRVTVMVAAAALCASAAKAQQLEVIYCEIPGHAKAVAPGALDETTNLPEAASFRSLTELLVSPDGSTWMVRGSTNQAATEEAIMLLGSGLAGTMFAQEGQAIPTGAVGEEFDFFGSGVGRFNTLNQFAYSARARGGVAAVFQKVILWNGVSSSIVAQMGDLYTGLIDQSPNPVGDEIAGNSIGSIHLLDSGVIGAHDTTIGNIHSSKRPAAFYNMAMFQQVENTTVLDYAGTSSITMDSMGLNSFYTTPDGAHWILEADIDMTVTSRNTRIYDGRVYLEPGQVVPGSGFIVGDVFNANLEPSGNWFARGRDNSGTTAAAPDFAARNATLIAKTGDSVEGGAETYGDTFAAFTGNGNGDWVLAANTSSAANANDVIVWNGTVVVREGDPVDVNGNGLFDDDAFIGRTSNVSVFQPDDMTLTDDNVLFFIATLRDGTGVDKGFTPAFGGPDVAIRLDLDPCGDATAYCTAGTSANGCVATISGTGTASASAGSGFTLDVAGVDGQRNGLIFYGITGPHAAQWAVGSSSFLCVKPPTQRTPAQNTGGTVGLCDGAMSVDWNNYIATHPGALGTPFAGGETVWSQGWYRDPASPKTTSLTNAVDFIVCP